MKPETEYALRKRIKELEAEIQKIRPYRVVAIDIFNGVAGTLDKQTNISKEWLISKYRQVMP